MGFLQNHEFGRSSRLSFGHECLIELILATRSHHSVASLNDIGVDMRERSLSVYCVIIFTSNLLFDDLGAVQHILNILYDFQFWYLVRPGLACACLLRAQDSWLDLLFVLVHNLGGRQVLILRVFAYMGRDMLLFIRFFITVNHTWSRSRRIIVVFLDAHLFVWIEIVHLFAVEASLVLLIGGMDQVTFVRRG